MFVRRFILSCLLSSHAALVFAWGDNHTNSYGKHNYQANYPSWQLQNGYLDRRYDNADRDDTNPWAIPSAPPVLTNPNYYSAQSYFSTPPAYTGNAYGQDYSQAQDRGNVWQNQASSPAGISTGIYQPENYQQKPINNQMQEGYGRYGATTNQQNNYAQPQYMQQADRAGNNYHSNPYNSWNGQRNSTMSVNPYTQQGSMLPTQNPYVNAPVKENTYVYQNRYQQAPRYVTPDVLENLRQQQMRTQRQPSQWQNQVERDANGLDDMNSPWKPTGDNLFSIMPYDMPGTPMQEQDRLYRGQSLPWVPDAAIGGIPPMNIFEPFTPAVSDQNGYTDAYSNGYNPFGVVPYKDLIP